MFVTLNLSKSPLPNLKNSAILTMGDLIMKAFKSFYMPFAILGMLFWPSVSVAMLCANPPDVVIPDDSINTGASDLNPGSPGIIEVVIPPGAEGTITDLNIQLSIDSTWVGDLIVTLTSPAGTVVTLIDRPGRGIGGAGGFGCSEDDIDVILDDSATTEAELQCATTAPAIGGTQQPFGNLSDFNGESISGTWTFTAVDFFPADQGTFSADGICLTGVTNPVTISQFKSRRQGKSLVFDWETSSESFNLGFDLWGNVDGEWQQLNRRLIESDSLDSVKPQQYRHRVNALKVEGDISQVGISSYSSSGKEDFYGPFEIGQEYGEAAVPEYVDWAYQRSLHDKAMIEAGYIKTKNRWRKNSVRKQARQDRQKRRFPRVIFDIESDGMYRITYEELLNQGINLNRMPLHKLSLTRDGVAIPRAVFNSKTKSKRRFGPGSELVFYGRGPSDSDSRYVGTAPYVLSLDSSKVIDISRLTPLADAGAADIGTIDQTHRFTENFGSKNIYSFGLEGDGWYDSSIRAIRRIGVKSINLDVSNDAVLDDVATIELLLFGVTSYPGIDVDGDGEPEPGHHYKVYLNRAEFPDAIAEGYGDGREFINVSQDVVGQLKHGDNEIQIELIPDNGHNIDLVYLVDGSMSYARPNMINGGALTVRQGKGESKTVAKTNGVGIDAVYATDHEHNVSQRPFTIKDGLVEVVNQANPSQRGPVMLRFVSEGGYATPENIYVADSVDPDELDLSEVDYVVISDASLRGEVLQKFVVRQEELGRRTKVVTSQTIFDAYSGGNPLPQAIADYLAEQSNSSPFKYVLLVGGHTYNYRAYNTDDSNRPINLIPSFYRATDFITKQIPTAVPFVDFDHDGAPDRAIGRWPVRDLIQLELVVNKTLTWHADGSHKDSKTGLFIADGNDEQNDFSQSVRRLTSSLGLDLNPWQAPDEVLLDTINADSSIDQGDKLTSARNQIVDGINKGPALTVYSGHGAPGVWGRQKLIYGSVSDRFENTTRPTFMMPLACYTTYYETPDIKSLPEVLFTDTAAGAVAISGSALLSDSSDNERFAQAVLKKMTVDGIDLGSAVLSAKQEAHKFSPRHQTVVYSWVTLGDPTLSFNLPKVEPLPSIDQSRGNHP